MPCIGIFGANVAQTNDKVLHMAAKITLMLGDMQACVKVRGVNVRYIAEIISGHYDVMEMDSVCTY